MSSSSRTTSKGGKGAKADKPHKTDGGKGGGDKIHNKENSPKNEEVSIKEKVKQLMELTRRSEDEVCLALHESNNDVIMAVELLYEEITTGEWEKKDKKKKKRQTSAGKQEKKGDDGAGVTDDWDDTMPPQSGGNNAGGGDGKEWKERGSGRRDNRSGGGSGPPRMGRGWREEGGGGRGGDRRGGGRGTTRGGGGRGRGGGRAGGRYPPRGNRGGGAGRDYNRQPIDTWDNSNTWDNSTATAGTNHAPVSDDWDDIQTDEWSTEEYTGSLMETKVFTPSVQPTIQENMLDPTGQPLNASTALDPNLSGTVQQDTSYSQSLGQTYNQTVQQLPAPQSPVPPPMVTALTPAQSQYFSQLSQQNRDTIVDKQFANTTYQTSPNTYDAKTNVQQVYSNSSSQVYTPSTQQYSGSAQQPYSTSTQQSYNSAAQPYNSSAAQQPSYNSGSASTQQPYNSASQQTYGNQAAQSYNNAVSQTYGTAQQSYGSAAAANSYGGGYQTSGTTYGTGQDVQPSQQPQRTKTQRARVPPPSKIPASAVEMPGDINSSMTYLDVQFGAMDLIDSSFESSATTEVKYGSESNRSTSGLENSRSTPTSGLDLGSTTSGGGGVPIDTGYGASGAQTKNGTQSSISSALSQGLSNTDSIPQTSEHLSYNNTASTRNASQGSSAQTSMPPVTTSTNLDLSKQATDGHSYSSQTASYNSYQSKANTYNASPYNTTQTTTSSYVNPSATSYVNNQANSYATGGTQNSSAGANAYANSYSSTAAAAATQAYQNASSSYPSVTQSANSYQTNAQQSYASSAQNPSGGSVYGANAGLTNNTNFTSATSQYNTYNSTSTGAGHKLSSSKENAYDPSPNATASVASTTTSNVAASNAVALSLSQTTLNSSKTTATLAKNSTSVMSNIPPGVTPVMSTPYIMGQVPYFQQPVYSYEDMQLLQQRLPHMTTPYYDMGYQTPTTLATVRGDPTAALSGYGAAAADGRFQTTGRAGDGTTSPVPASQQQQQQQPPILAAGTAPPYFFATAFNTIAAPPPNYAQFGTMYTQLPAVTNAHGSSANNQYGPKPATYGSAGYGAYDALGQSAQDYTKGAYVGTAAAAVAAAAAQQAAQKGQANSTTAGSAANDLSAMYGKSHAALGKVNSYEKQGFHSGTPPPFTGTLSQSAGLAPSGTGYAPQVYIPTMAQHHSTMAMHQPLHQMDVRHQGRRADSGNSSGQRSQGSNQAKAGTKQGYGASYWNQN